MPTKEIKELRKTGKTDEAFAMAKAGMTLRAIANQFTLENIPTPNGKTRWLGETVSRILSNRYYIGEATARQYRVTREAGKRKVARREENEQIPLPAGVVPAIVDHETFDAVQVKLQKNKAEYPKRADPAIT